MRYVFESGKPKRVMHIMKPTITSEETFTAFCEINLPFNRTINAPFGLGRKICKNCKKKSQLT